MNYIKKIPDIARLLKGSNYIDVKSVEGLTSLRHFIAAMLSYYPRWIIFLYRLRAILVKLLGLYRHPVPDELPQLTPEDVSFVIGDAVTFFTVRKAKEKFYWIGETPEDKHLSAYFCVAVEPLDDYCKRFHVATIVYYKHWTGPLYFNLIRPFHHLVVSRMMQAGVHHK